MLYSSSQVHVHLLGFVEDRCGQCGNPLIYLGQTAKLFMATGLPFVSLVSGKEERRAQISAEIDVWLNSCNGRPLPRQKDYADWCPTCRFPYPMHPPLRSPRWVEIAVRIFWAVAMTAAIGAIVGWATGFLAGGAALGALIGVGLGAFWSQSAREAVIDPQAAPSEWGRDFRLLRRQDYEDLINSGVEPADAAPTWAFRHQLIPDGLRSPGYLVLGQELVMATPWPSDTTTGAARSSG